MNFSTAVGALSEPEDFVRYFYVRRIEERPQEDPCAWRISMGPNAYCFLDTEAFQKLRALMNEADEAEQKRVSRLEADSHV